ncbi:non-ribosomal peptide synthetase [Clostridium cavendishii]|uniref:non-ribosomal peptide synthetase n=1 Tax=Clostridium cavendishii TaxID=349931 RepID=UPI000932CB3D|nr:non-ribosomal peptide synthetase [Clostridium cavendishii]
MEKVKKHILREVANKSLTAKEAKILLSELDNFKKVESNEVKNGEFAIIGIGLNFPGADNLEEYWNIINNGYITIGEFPDNRKKDINIFMEDAISYRKGGYLQSVDNFDARFFNISPQEAERMDPQQRLFLQVAFSAIEDSGIDINSIKGSSTGVFVGHETTSIKEYFKAIENSGDELAITGCHTGIMASRISYLLNLKGPALVIDTACSSSLVALHVALQSLKAGECKQAIVGGVTLHMIPETGGMVYEASNDKVKAFDKHANGTVWSEGIAAILIKPLEKAKEDNDNIYAIIKGSSANNDGTTSSITAPSSISQAEVIQSCWEDARVDPETISYIETHGTGTVLGDPIEIKGLTQAFEKYTNKKQFCGIGSVKNNIGHTVGCSGLASIIKVVLALKYKKLPGTVGFVSPNSLIDFISSPVFFNSHTVDWNPACKIRRCGVSAFGFSGTNVHILLEEADEKKIIKNDKKNYLFTCSAKTEQALLMQIMKYLNYLRRNPNISLSDFCYTASISRGQYQHRVAIIFNNKEQILGKLMETIGNNLVDFNVPDKNQFYGFHKIVRLKNGLSRNELNDGQIRKISKKADLFIKTNKESQNIDVLREICSMYINGATINWQEFYEEGLYNKISIPGYPFEKKRFWISPSETIKTEKTKKHNDEHPLLGDIKLITKNKVIFESRISVEESWILQEHKVDGDSIIPGTAYIEMAVVAGKRIFNQSVCSIEDIQIYSPITMNPYKERTVQFIVSIERNQIGYEIISSNLDDNYTSGNWTIHGSGKYVLHRGEENPSKQFSLEEFKQECSKIVEFDIEDVFKEGGAITFGPRWNCIKKLQTGNDKALVELQLNTDFLQDLKQYHLHPALLDCAISVGAHLSQRKSKVYLPVSYRKVKVFGNLPAKVYALLCPVTDIDNEEFIKYNVCIMDEHEKCLVEIDGIILKLVTNFSKLKVQQQVDFKYQIKFKQNKFQNKFEEFTNGADIVVIGGNEALREGFSNAYKDYYNEAIFVEFGHSYFRKNNTSFVISSDMESFDSLFSVLKSEFQVTHIIYIGGMLSDDNTNTLNELENILDRGLYSLFYMTKSMVKKFSNNDIEVILISKYAYKVTGDELVVHPENAALFGLAKSVCMEYPNIHCRLLDIDTEIFTDIFTEDLWSNKTNFLAAYRNNQRYRETLCKYEGLKQSEHKIINDGIYVITGGTGDLGLEIAEHIARKANVTLILVTRSEFPKREAWHQIQRENNGNVSKKVNKIIEIEKHGSKVYTMCMQIQDLNNVTLAFDKIRSTFGRINGVIHCAGVAGDGFIFRKDFKTFYDVISPKIQGTWILDQVTKQDKLDFMVLFSSITAILSGIGQGDYTAANAYLDSFASQQGESGKIISVNWPAWSEIGMAKRFNVNNDGIFKALLTSDALEFFDNALQISDSNIILGQLNQEKLPNLIETNIIEVDQELLLGNIINKEIIEDFKLGVDHKVSVELHGRLDNNYSNLERKVAQVWADILSVSSIDVFESFYDMGGNSILAIRLANALNEAFSTKLDISHIFELLTVEEMVKYIDKKDRNASSVQISKLEAEENYVHDLFGMQKHIWFLQKYSPQSTVYQVPTYFYMNEKVDIDIVKKSFFYLQQTNDALNVVIEEHSGVPKQRLINNFSPMFSFEDLSKEYDRNNLLLTRMEEENNKVFDFEKPLWKVILYKLEEEKYCLYLNIHHIITDGWSEGILFDQFVSIYNKLKTKESFSEPKNKYGYLDWIYEEELHLKDHRVEYSNYWLDELKGPLPILNLPIDFPRKDNQTYVGGAYTKRISVDRTIKVKELAKYYKTTINTVLLAVYYKFLSKICNQDELIIGIPIVNRNNLESEKLVGLLMNIVCIRINSEGCGDFYSLIEIIKEKCKLAYKYGRYPFEQILSSLELERYTNINAVYQTMFQFFENHQISNNSSLFDLNFMGKEVNGQIELRMEYATDLFRSITIERFMDQYLTILDQVEENKHIDLNKIELMTKVEEGNLLDKYSNPHLTENSIIIKKIEEIAQLYPDKNAICYLDEKLTYEELMIQSGRLATLLIKNGLKKGQPVGILMNKGIPMIVAIIAVVRAGASYLPLDPEYPQERIQYMLKHSNTNIVITSYEVFKDFNQMDWEDRYIVLTDNLPKIIPKGLNFILADETSEVTNIDFPDIDSNDLMDIIYTSGSTGLPKGVMVTHGNVSNFIHWSLNEFNITVADRLMLVTSISFDISVFEIFATLASGAELYIVSKDTLQDANEMFKFICKNKISIWHSVPSLVKQFLMGGLFETEDAEMLKCVKKVLIGGEAWTAELAKLIKKRFSSSELFNMYGPTEATIWVTSYRVDEELYNDSYSIVPIGRPIWNNNVLILDDCGALCPIGIPGQIILTGENITKGYINDLEKTKQNFSWINQFDKIGYKTGDIGMYTDNGYIVYLGRNDGMVKIRGYRVECGEIENIVQSCKGIKECAVVTAEENGTNKLLCFYEVIENKSDICYVAQLKELLQQHVPHYMIPAHFIVMTEIPKTSNGKIDRQRLDKLDWKQMLPDVYEQQEEANEIEKNIYDIWISLLDYDRIGLNSNFFDVGGNSLLVSRMNYSIEELYPGMITIADIFAYPTIKKLSSYIMDKMKVVSVVEDNERLDVSMDELFSLVAKGEISAADAANILKKRGEV